jgi:hypothetical protein
MSEVAARHSGDLTGQLIAIDQILQPAIKVQVSPSAAALPAVQHTSWMLMNMLSRLDRIIREISLSCPGSVSLAGRIVPLVDRHLFLDEALEAGNVAIGVVPLGSASPDITVHVGPVPDSNADLNVYGEAWWGGVLQGRIDYSGTSQLPFGPYAAACIAVGEIFKRARMLASRRIERRQVFVSMWSYNAGTQPDRGGPDELPPVDLSCSALAGVGAVGSTLLHALWTTRARGSLRIADNDLAGIDKTNLNRYSLFGSCSVGHQKASEAARILEDASFGIDPINDGFERLYDDNTMRPVIVASAVDTNSARSNIQNRYAPRILSASTSDLRAEVLRCGPPGVGACLACFNPPERSPADEELISRLQESPERICHVASAVGIGVSEIQDWLSSPEKCGETSTRILEELQRSENEPARFAVGFVSVIAGTMLASELVKTLGMSESSILGNKYNRAVFQFFDPLSYTNRAHQYLRDPACHKCAPLTPALEEWKRRFDSSFNN